jgi:type VI secretion system protein ImpM
VTTAEPAGFFGKVVTLGDFVSRRLPRSFLDPWDRWLQQGLTCSRDQLGDAWLDVYLTSPIWHFALASGVCGDAGWVGLVLPSVDRVGRYFPLTVAAPRPPGAGAGIASLVGAADWLARAEQLALTALDESFDLDAFDRALALLAPPDDAGRRGASGILVPREPPGWHFPNGPDGSLASVSAPLADALLDACLPLHSAWTTRGSDRVAPCTAVARGLPPAAAFAALLDGGWERSGWSSSAASALPPAARGEAMVAVAAPPAADSEPSWSAAARTHQGNVRKHNEDACLSLPERRIWVVADGMGGHADGDVASREVVRSLEALADDPSLGDLARAARGALGTVNARLRERAAAGVGRASVIGSTVVALLARGARAVCLWAGDSRIYRLRDGELRALTRDHSVVEELVMRGELSPEVALAHPEANALTRAVGGDDALEIESIEVAVQSGDLFLLCSDGLTKEVAHAEMREILGRAPDPAAACDALVQAALANGGRDNVTVVVARADAPGR